MCIEIKCHTETHKMMFLQIELDGHYKVIHKRLKQIFIDFERIDNVQGFLSLS